MNLSESYKKRLQELSGINSKPYFRAQDEFIGDSVVFEPNGYYEAVDEDGFPIEFYGEFAESETKEIAASEYIGGAVMGNFSMHYNMNRKIVKKYFIYKIDDSPDIDISHWDKGDFSHIKEVRYRRNVAGNFIGEVNLSDEQTKALKEYYNLLSQAIEGQWEDPSEEEISEDELWFDEYYNSGKFEQMLKAIKPL